MVTKNCANCDAEFEGHLNQKYCTYECRRIRNNWQTMIRRREGKDWSKTCEVCGITYQNKAFNSKTCSKTCAKIRAKTIRPRAPSKIQPTIKKICECGKEFAAVGLGRTRLSCSKECADKRRQKQISEWHHKKRVLKVKTCEFCPTTFNPHGPQKTCQSDECKKKLSRKNNRKNYKTPPVEKTRAYRNKHKDRINAYMRDYRTKRMQRSKHRISSRMYAAVRREVKKFGASTTKTIQGLYTNEELFNHLESQFTDGMSWDNMSEWHIDHIRPVASFDYDSTDHPDFKKCWALNNLQPMWAKDNMSKGAKWDGKVNA